MSDRLLMGLGRYMLPIPGLLWKRQVLATARRIQKGLRFMTEEHHLVRDFVVRELPGAGEPLAPEFIAGKLGLGLERVQGILNQLEKRLIFLFSNEQGAVTWAYPVTVDTTPHHATFSTGEEAYSP